MKETPGKQLQHEEGFSYYAFMEDIFQSLLKPTIHFVFKQRRACLQKNRQSQVPQGIDILTRYVLYYR